MVMPVFEAACQRMAALGRKHRRETRRHYEESALRDYPTQREWCLRHWGIVARDHQAVLDALKNEMRCVIHGMRFGSRIPVHLWCLIGAYVAERRMARESGMNSHLNAIFVQALGPWRV